MNAAAEIHPPFAVAAALRVRTHAPSRRRAFAALARLATTLLAFAPHAPTRMQSSTPEPPPAPADADANRDPNGDASGTPPGGGGAQPTDTPALKKQPT
ncbi:MAG TPA: hypothetical protein VGC30_05960 [Dokdonella sp.]